MIPGQVEGYGTFVPACYYAWCLFDPGGAPVYSQDEGNGWQANPNLSCPSCPTDLEAVAPLAPAGAGLLIDNTLIFWLLVIVLGVLLYDLATRK